MASISPGNAWADGYALNSKAKALPVLVHWDGTTWKPSTNPAPALSRLTDVAAVSPSDIWAVGWTDAFYPMAVILHWNGTEWTSVSA